MDPIFPALLYTTPGPNSGKGHTYDSVQVNSASEWNEKILDGYYPHPDIAAAKPDHEEFLIDEPKVEPKEV